MSNSDNDMQLSVLVSEVAKTSREFTVCRAALKRAGDLASDLIRLGYTEAEVKPMLSILDGLEKHYMAAARRELDRLAAI